MNRRSAPSVRRNGSEWKNSTIVENASSLLLRTKWDDAENHFANGEKAAIANGMNAMKEIPSAADREQSANPAASIVTIATMRRG